MAKTSRTWLACSARVSVEKHSLWTPAGGSAWVVVGHRKYWYSRTVTQCSSRGISPGSVRCKRALSDWRVKKSDSLAGRKSLHFWVFIAFLEYLTSNTLHHLSVPSNLDFVDFNARLVKISLIKRVLFNIELRDAFL